MKKFMFTVRIIGVGDNVDSAWIDATEATDLSSDSLPNDEDILDCGDADE